MPNDEWSRGKCGLKVLQFMAAGLPVVANPVGVHIEMVKPGETGLLAETAREWVQAIGYLAHDPALRQQMGQTARKRVESNYSVSVGARLWLDLLEHLERKAA
jgi:glycosyltransferase involved in cell wall biosynthesis